MISRNAPRNSSGIPNNSSITRLGNGCAYNPRTSTTPPHPPRAAASIPSSSTAAISPTRGPNNPTRRAVNADPSTPAAGGALAVQRHQILHRHPHRRGPLRPRLTPLPRQPMRYTYFETRPSVNNPRITAGSVTAPAPPHPATPPAPPRLPQQRPSPCTSRPNPIHLIRAPTPPNTQSGTPCASGVLAVAGPFGTARSSATPPPPGCRCSCCSCRPPLIPSTLLLC